MFITDLNEVVHNLIWKEEETSFPLKKKNRKQYKPKKKIKAMLFKSV